ncbi:FecR family protein [Zunongwangia sp. F260]|uniref:FecR family protein n=1 Tax=Autumnicola lenta TaxID=3075593 RepID=A0ABU3CGE8_9FLAO|nr:FecR family protein [Zunongwangia sp. F260]MDT0645371.1 FecR family protein [Zunongwangia sp. F260]
MKNREFNNKDVERFWNASYSELPKDQIEESWQKFSSANSLKDKSSFRRNYYGAGMAAAVLVLLFSTYYYVALYNPIIQINNYGLLDKQVNLPDGSLVLLKEGGEIKYKEHFSARKVEIKGEAFFDVVKDSSREFNVISGSTTTKVLGTKFSVSEKGSKGVEISLYTGRIMVKVKGQAESWGLIPGESLAYHQGITKIRKFNTTLSFALGNKFIDVNNIELEELFDFLGRRFNYKFSNSDLTEKERVTLRINKEDSLAEILHLLSIINNISYEIKEEKKQVEISRK